MKPLPTLLEVPPIPIVSQRSRTVNFQGGAGGENGDFGTTTKQSKNEGIQYVKWADSTGKDWEEEYPPDEPPQRQ